MIKFGIFMMPQHPIEDSSLSRFNDLLIQVNLAKDLGFDTIACGHHYLSPPFQNIQNIPLLSRLSADAGEMYLCTSIVLLALLNPVQIAEEIASLDVMSGGKVIFGVGLGYRDVEYKAFNVKVADGAHRLVESLELIKMLWTQNSVTFKGKFFHLDNVNSTIKPIQKPYPPIWLAANADIAVKRAGLLGYPWFINPHASLSTTVRQMGIYREQLYQAGHEAPVENPICLELYVAPTYEKAIEIARPFLAAKYLSYSDWGQDKVLPGNESFRRDFHELAEDRFILGSPDDVIREIERRIKLLGCNHFIFRIGWPGMDNSDVLNAIKLMGKFVLPHFRKSK